MPLKRLDRARASLPAGYQFGDAQDAVIPVTMTTETVWALCRCGAEVFSHDALVAHRCGVTANVIEGEQH